MGNKISVQRRQFLSGIFGNKNSNNTKVNSENTKFGGDPYFEKYANKEMPLGVARTQSALTTYAGPWTETEMLHLLRRVTFGARKEDVDVIKQMSLSSTIDFIIDNPALPDSVPVNSYQNDYADTLGCPSGNSWVDFNVPFAEDFTLEFFRIQYSFTPWWMGQIINQPVHIQEKMTLFWSNHFSTQTGGIVYAKANWRYHELLRTNALGNLKDLLKEVTIDPGMLYFLNGVYNSVYAPDENYARELQELFTVGKGPGSQYTETDVQLAAKVLTGWRVKANNPDGNYTSYFDPAQHDTSDKQFSAFYNNRIITGKTGIDGAMEMEELIDMLLETNETAKYICRRLYRWFVYYVIDETTEANIITPLANIYRSNNYNIKPVLKALFSSEHFFDPLNTGCIIKSPIELFAGLYRVAAIYVPPFPIETRYLHWRQVKGWCENQGQSIADPPNVAGWKAYYQEPVYYEAWISADTIQKRAKLLNDLSSGGTYFDNGNFVKIDSIAFNKKFPNPQNPNAVISDFITYLLPKGVSDEQKIFIKNILLSNQSSDYYWTNAWNAYIANPGDTTLRFIVRSRLDSVINYILNLEEYQLT